MFFAYGFLQARNFRTVAIGQEFASPKGNLVTKKKAHSGREGIRNQNVN